MEEAEGGLGAVADRIKGREEEVAVGDEVSKLGGRFEVRTEGVGIGLEEAEDWGFELGLLCVELEAVTAGL